MRLRRSFEGHQRGVSHIAWSPDSLHIIVCGPEDSSELIVWNTEVSWYRSIHCEPKKTWQYVCDHNSGKTHSIFIIFALSKQEET